MEVHGRWSKAHGFQSRDLAELRRKGQTVRAGWDPEYMDPEFPFLGAPLTWTAEEVERVRAWLAHDHRSKRHRLLKPQDNILGRDHSTNTCDCGLRLCAVCNERGAG
jgi:hypothetical protein